MPRWMYAVAVFLALGTGFSLPGAGPSGAQAQTGPCRLARGDSPVAKACAEGGIVRAKQVMRSMIKQARGAGLKYQCEDCHTDDRSYDRLTSDAKEKFAKLLAASPRK